MHGKKRAAQPVNTDVRLCFGKTKEDYGGSATGQLPIGEGLVFANLATHVLSLSALPTALHFFSSMNYKCPPTLGSGDAGRNAGLPLAFH